MGGYVSARAACQLKVDGLFLLAPAFHIPGYAQSDPRPNVRHMEIVHGWQDQIIPWEHSTRWASSCLCTLHLVDGDHRLNSALDVIEPLFRNFVRRLSA